MYPMFDKDFDLRGKHATYTKFLCNEAKVFKRYIDVYMVSVVIGFLYGSPKSRDAAHDSANILAGVFANERAKCEFLYRLVMLLDETSEITVEARIDRAFRIDDSSVDDMKNNMDLFHSYVYGGIEVLYEKFLDCTTKDDYIDKIHDMVRIFEHEINGDSYEESISELIIRPRMT